MSDYWVGRLQEWGVGMFVLAIFYLGAVAGWHVRKRQERDK